MKDGNRRPVKKEGVATGETHRGPGVLKQERLGSCAQLEGFVEKQAVQWWGRSV